MLKLNSYYYHNNNKVQLVRIEYSRYPELNGDIFLKKYNIIKKIFLKTKKNKIYYIINELELKEKNNKKEK